MEAGKLQKVISAATCVPKQTGSQITQFWWRRGESNPRPKSATPRSLHAYLSSGRKLLSQLTGSPAAVRTSKKRHRLVRLVSPAPSGPKGLGQLTV